MIPNSSLSQITIPGFWIPPDDLENDSLRDYELGGIDLNDPSFGLRFQVWTLTLMNDDVVISAPTVPLTVLFTRTGITELSLAFDQNMNPFVAFVENGVAKFWWYDTVVSQQVFSSLPANSITPRTCLDDKRETQTNSSDIILAYLLNDNLYFRAERDRYSVQYLLKTGVFNPTSGLPARLKRVGMTDQNRLQFLLQSDLPKGYRC